MEEEEENKKSCMLYLLRVPASHWLSGIYLYLLAGEGRYSHARPQNLTTHLLPPMGGQIFSA